MRKSHRIHPILVLAVSLALFSTPLHADDLGDFVFQEPASNPPAHHSQSKKDKLYADPTPPSLSALADDPTVAVTESSTPSESAALPEIKEKPASKKKSKKRTLAAKTTAPASTITAATAIVAPPATPDPATDNETQLKFETQAFASTEARTRFPDSSSDSSDALQAQQESPLQTAAQEFNTYTDTGAPGVTPPPEALNSLWKSAQDVAVGALGLLGVRYQWGGNTPESGLDCSGFVQYVFKQAKGIKLPRSSREISQVGQHVGWNNLIPGDLVFFNTRRFAFSHVGIYLGDNRFIHSPTSGRDVEIGRITDRYWSARFNGGRRILGMQASRKPQNH